MKRQNPVRILNLIGLITGILLLAVAYFLQYVMNQMPCLLCLLQRFALILLLPVFLLGAIHAAKSWGRYIYGFLIIIIASAGLSAAIRQTWLQHQPLTSQVTCVPGLNFLLQTHPLPEVIRIMFHGGRDCAEVLFRVLGLTLAEWTGIFFVGFIVLGVLHFFVRPRR